MVSVADDPASLCVGTENNIAVGPVYADLRDAVCQVAKIQHTVVVRVYRLDRPIEAIEQIPIVQIQPIVSIDGEGAATFPMIDACVERAPHDRKDPPCAALEVQVRSSKALIYYVISSGTAANTGQMNHGQKLGLLSRSHLSFMDGAMSLVLSLVQHRAEHLRKTRALLCSSTLDKARDALLQSAGRQATGREIIDALQFRYIGR
jgi:hypothetical protein